MAKDNKPDFRPPPRWVAAFLKTFCSPHLLEEIQGDLLEFYHLWTRKYGPRKAKWLYIMHTIRFLRPFAIRRKNSLYPNRNYMLTTYFTIALRSLIRQRRFTALNLAGLTLGITTALVIFLILRFELSFDNFHHYGERIYRVITGRPQDIGDAGTPHGLMEVLEDEFPQIEKVAVAYKPNPDKTQLQVGGELTREREIYFVTPSFFEIFNFKWVAGNPAKSLSRPGQVVIDEDLAQKYFEGDPIGQPIRLDNQFDLVVTGIIKNAPKNTDFPIQMAVSHATFENSNRFRQKYNGAYGSYYHTYVLLQSGTDPAVLEAGFPDMVRKYLGEEMAQKYLAHALQPLNDIHFNPKTGGGNFTKRSVSHQALATMGLIGIFLLITACINFVNLATVQTITRSREAGIRKVLGSSKWQLIKRFFDETFIVTFLAVCLSFAIAYVVLPFLSTYLSIPVDPGMVFGTETLVFMLVTGFLVVILSGLYPAITLSRFKPVDAIKNSLVGPKTSGQSLRKLLVVLQFSISQVLIICTIVVINQSYYLNATYLGFDKDAVVTVDLPESDMGKLTTLRNSLSRHTVIKDISFSLNTPAATINRWYDVFLHPSEPEKLQTTENKFIDEHYLPFYDIPLIAGRNLTESDSSQIIVNEAFLRKIGIDDPRDALGETITYWGRKVSITGVCQDFHSVSLHEEIYPLILWRNTEFFQKASFKIDMKQASMAIDKIEHSWNDTFPGYYFTYEFLDRDLSTFYRQERKLSRLISLFAGIAIFIGCLGLYGLVSFVVTRKVREVGIRKVLGASVRNIVYLFSKDFALLIGIAFLLAAPVGYHFMNRWLEDFPYKIDMAWWMFALAAFLGFLIAGLTIIFRTLRAAYTNPAEALRNE